jgi:hypothetical protein
MSLRSAPFNFILVAFWPAAGLPVCVDDQRFLYEEMPKSMRV